MRITFELMFKVNQKFNPIYFQLQNIYLQEQDTCLHFT